MKPIVRIALLAPANRANNQSLAATLSWEAYPDQADALSARGVFVEYYRVFLAISDHFYYEPFIVRPERTGGNPEEPSEPLTFAYCNWLSGKMGLSPAYDANGNMITPSAQVTRNVSMVAGIRLPTEAEWEYAARGGNADIVSGVETNKYVYSGGNNLGEVAWYCDNSGSKTQPVGQKAPNELGIYDMTGNVEEWCFDWFANYIYSGSVMNPTGA